MKTKQTFYATVENGKLLMGERIKGVMSMFLSSLKGKIYFEIGKVESKRTISQNNFYWMYLGVIAEDTGNNANDLHEYFKRVLLLPIFQTVEIKGKKIEIKIPASTKKLSKLEFGEYIEKICALTGIPIPETELFLSLSPFSPSVAGGNIGRSGSQDEMARAGVRGLSGATPEHP